MLPRSGDIVAAGADFGFRSDSSALVFVHKRESLLWVAEILELRPENGKPLKPSETVAKFAARMKAHGVTYLMADGHYRESIDEHLVAAGLAYVPAPNKPVDAYMRTRALLRQGSVRLPNHQRMLQQIHEIQGRPLPGGGMSVISPRWRQGGHGDIVAALVLALYQLGGEEIPFAKTTTWEEDERAKRRLACKEAQTDGVAWWKARGSRPGPRR